MPAAFPFPLTVASAFLVVGLCTAGCDASPEPQPESKAAAEAQAQPDPDAADEAETAGAAEPTTDTTPHGKDATTGDVTGGDATGGDATTGDATGDSPAPDATPQAPPSAPKPEDIRDPAYVPAGTPDAHAEAFKALPVAKGDGAPIGGIGAGGIHLDDLVVGRGWEDSRCQEPASTFSVASDDKVSVCLRIVHQPTEEPLTISWNREGKSPRKASVTVKGIHAYRTRAWLPVKNYYVGKWTVQVLAADGTLLGEGTFEITP